jgi:hypothetical protein
MESLKPDCRWALQRKGRQSVPARVSVTLSPVRIAGKVLEIAAISSDSLGIAASFLCNKDWVAERVGFSNAFYYRLCAFNEMPKTEVLTGSYVLSHLQH